MEPTTDQPIRPGHTKLLIVRLWLEPDAARPLRARLLERENGQIITTEVAAGVEAIAAMIRRHLEPLQKTGTVGTGTITTEGPRTPGP